ncbi:hypothetical protein KVC37_03585 [Helicobacter pylori]|nr:hypothetical protein KVC37_03585 [Helicobacter pylori]
MKSAEEYNRTKYERAERLYSEKKRSANERAVINNKDKIAKIIKHSPQDKKTLQELKITDKEMEVLYRMGLGVLPPSVFSFFIPSLSGGGGGYL